MKRCKSSVAQAMHEERGQGMDVSWDSKRNKLIFSGWSQESSELAAHAAALVALAAVAAPVAQGDVALTLLPDVTRHHPRFH